MLKRHLPSLLIRRSWPDSTLPWRRNPLRIQRVFDFLIQLHLRIVIETVRPGNLIQQRQMCTMFTPTLFHGIVEERADQFVRLLAGVGVFAIVDDADDVVRFPQADHEGADEVEAESSDLRSVSSYWATASSPETFAMRDKERWPPLGSLSTRLSLSTEGIPCSVPSPICSTLLSGTSSSK